MFGSSAVNEINLQKLSRHIVLSMETSNFVTHLTLDSKVGIPSMNLSSSAAKARHLKCTIIKTYMLNEMVGIIICSIEQ